MAILNIFKKGKGGADREKPAEKNVQKAEKKPVAAEKEKPQKPKKTEKKSKTSFAYANLKGPHVTEKASMLQEKGQYVFEIFPRATKNEVEKSVEKLYGVNVVSVKIVKIPRKKVRFGRTPGFKPAYKKAIVKIAEGQKIEILPR